MSLAKTFGGPSALREILETVLLALVLFLILRTATVNFRVYGQSMEPTLHEGQFLIISRVTYWFHPPERGDIIVFHPPTNPSEDYIKRVVGLPGERVELREGQVWIDGVLLEEPYIMNPDYQTNVWVLGGDEYFVLGDNRANSSDSHRWGVLPRENIVGKSWLCYWPPEDWGVTPHYTFSADVGQVEQ